MKSFRNDDGVLTAWGYAESNGADIARDEPCDFNLEPGKWQLVGDVWQPYTVTHVPRSVSMRQGREALIRRGKIAIVEQAIASMPGVEGQIARNEWERSQVIERHRPLTASMFALIGVTDEAARDEWFVFASTL